MSDLTIDFSLVSSSGRVVVCVYRKDGAVLTQRDIREAAETMRNLSCHRRSMAENLLREADELSETAERLLLQA